jgi:hypothetical protein
MRSLLEPQPRFGGAFSWALNLFAPATYIRLAMPPAFIPPRLALPRRPKHDGYPMMARRRDGHDWTEVVCCDERGLATFQLLRHRRNEPHASSRP